MLRVPSKCLVCESRWTGGSQLPDKPFRGTGQRVFYKCGASMSIKEEFGNGYLILFKNCKKEK